MDQGLDSVLEQMFAEFIPVLTQDREDMPYVRLVIQALGHTDQGIADAVHIHGGNTPAQVIILVQMTQFYS